MSFREFNKEEIERCKEKYAQEAEERWGGTQAYKESKKRSDSYGSAEWEELTQKGNSIMQAFADCRGLSPESGEVQELAARWQAYISSSYYDCTDEILEGLGLMYTSDERFRQNIDRFGEGTAELMSQGIACYVRNKKDRK